MATTVRPFTGVFELDPTHSIGSVRRQAHRLDVPRVVQRHRGTPGGRRHPVKLRASAEVKSISIIDPPEFRDHVVRGDDFFQADAHPEMTFSSANIALRDDGSAIVIGELAIRGISRTVTAEGSYTAPAQDPFGTRSGCARTPGDRRPARLGPELAAGAAGRRRRRRLGGRADSGTRARQGRLTCTFSGSAAASDGRLVQQGIAHGCR